MESAKEPVRIRTKKLSNGNESVYLDIYYDGKRKKEYLKLYLVPERTRSDKLKNKETLELASTVKAKRIVELRSDTFGFETTKANQKTNLLEWLEKEREYYHGQGNHNYSYTIRNLIRHISAFSGDKTNLQSVDTAYIRRFQEYLKGNVNKYGGKLSPETVYTYFTVLSILLNKAVRLDMIPSNPFHKLAPSEKPKRTSSNRVYLTLEEVKRLSETECGDWRVKYAFLFCCFTGLRYIDVSRLRWKHIKRMDNGEYQLEIVQEKTKEPVYIPLSENALKWLPEKGVNGWDNLVFPFGDRSIIYDYLKKWAKDAGIEKDIVFHTSRHTCATLLLRYGADIYTVSKILGHTSVKTTQIYAKVMDETKKEAVNMVPKIDVG